MARPKKASLYRSRGLFYVSFWRDGRRVRESTGTDNRKVAEEVRHQREREMVLGAVGLEQRFQEALNDPGRRAQVLAALEARPSAPVGKVLDEYYTLSQTFKRPKTFANDRGRLEPLLRPLADMQVAEVGSRLISSILLVRIDRDGISPTTVLRLRENLHAFFEFARKHGYVGANPVDAIDRPRPPERDIRFLDLPGIEKCLDAVEGDLIEPLIVTAIYAGLRREEHCWLTWEDIDLEKRLLRVRSKTVDGESWMPKTKKNRTVPISTSLLPHLVGVPLPHVGWLFKSPKGLRWDPDNLGHRLAKLMKRAKLPWNFLDLRHTFGSQLAQKGVSLYKISELMGNSPEIARRHYARLIPEQMHSEVEFESPGGGMKAASN